jgi:hypothetical protein
LRCKIFQIGVSVCEEYFASIASINYFYLSNLNTEHSITNQEIFTLKSKPRPDPDLCGTFKTWNRYKGRFWLQFARQCRYQRFSARIIERNRATGRVFDHFWPWRYLTQDHKALLRRGGKLLDACYIYVLVKFRLNSAFKRWLGAVERIMFLRDQGKAATDLHAWYETSYRIHAAWLPVSFAVPNPCTHPIPSTPFISPTTLILDHNHPSIQQFTQAVQKSVSGAFRLRSKILVRFLRALLPEWHIVSYRRIRVKAAAR